MALTEKHKSDITKVIAKECQSAEENAPLILSAPKACFMIEALTILASCTPDPSLVDEQTKFTYLKTPNSFKASLYQVINEMCDAFRVAHNSMSIIEKNLNGMPSVLNDIFDGIADPEDTQEMIDDSMKSTKFIANNCTKAAEAAVTGFSSALKTIEELCQATIATQARSDARLKEAKEEEQIQSQIRAQQEQRLKELQDDLQKQRQLANEALDEYKTQMSKSADMGNMFTLLLMDSLQSVVHCASSAVKDLGSFVGEIPKNVLLNAKNAMSHHTYLNKKDFLSAGVEQALVTALEEMVSSDEAAWQKEDIDTYIGTFKTALEYKLDTKSGKALYDKGKAVLEVLKLAKNGEAHWKAKYAEVKPGVKLLVAACKNSTESAHAQADHDVQMAAIKSQEKQSLMQMQQKNLETAQQHTKQQQELAEALRKDKQLADEKLNETINKLARLNTEKQDLGEILYYLKQGISQLIEVQTAWKRIVTFFDHIKNTVDGPLMLSLKDFIPSDDPENPNSISANVGKAKMRKLVCEATKACGVGNVLLEMAKLYKNVSDKYIMAVIDDSLQNMSLTQEQAKQLQHRIPDKYSRKKGELEDVVATFQKQLHGNVYAALKAEGFDVGRAITDNKNEKKALEDAKK